MGGRLDVIGAIGLSVGLILTLIAVSKGNSWGWDQPRTLGTLAGGVVVLLLWGWFELRVDEPLADLRVTAQLPVLLTNLAAVAIGFGMMAQAIVVPQLLQLPKATGYGIGLTVLQAGLLMAPGGLMMLLFAPVSSRLIQNAGAKRTLVIGATVLGSGYVVAAFLMHTPVELLIASCIASAGVGIGYAAMPTLIMASVPMTEAGSAVGINGLMRSIGTTVASAVMAALLTSSTTDFGGFAAPDRVGVPDVLHRRCRRGVPRRADRGRRPAQPPRRRSRPRRQRPSRAAAPADVAPSRPPSSGSSRIGPAPTSVSGSR